MAIVRTNRVPVPDSITDTAEARKADYSVAVRIEGGATLTPEQWARGCFEGAPAVLRVLLVLGWRFAFRLRLGPQQSLATVLGWFVTESSPVSATLAAGSPLIEAQHIFVRDAGDTDGIVWVSLVRSHTRLGRILWRLVAPGHELTMPWLLRRAARTPVRTRDLARVTVTVVTSSAGGPHVPRCVRRAVPGQAGRDRRRHR